LNKLKLLIILAVISATISSCIPSKPVEEELNASPERIIKKLEANRRKVKTFYGTGILNIDSPEFSGKANFEVNLKKPDSIKIAVFGPFGIDIAQAMVTGKDFIFHDVLQNKVYKGKSNAPVLKKIFRIDLSFDEIVDAFAGSVNLTDQLSGEPDNFTSQGDDIKINYYDSKYSKNTSYLIARDELTLKRYLVSNSDGQTMIEGSYSEFRSFEEVPVPYRISVKNPDLKQNIEIEYRNIEINKTSKLFKIKIPEDAEVIEWRQE